MAAQVLSFFRRPAAPRDWSAEELAEFYRVEAALIQAGLRVDSERGLTDEGEPWFIFCRAEDDEVVIHFARIDGQYVISAPAYCGDAVGYDFRALVRKMIERHPVLRPRPSDNNLFLHPAALLVVLVASALLKAGHADAAPAAGHGAGDEATDEKSRGGTPSTIPTVAPEAPHETLMLAAITAAIGAPLPAETITIEVRAPAYVFHSTDQPAEHSTGELLDQPHAPLPTVGSSTPPPAFVYPELSTLTLVDSVPTHTAPVSDSLVTTASFVTPPAPQAWLLLNALLPPPSSTSPFEAVAHPNANAQFVPLSALSDISQADKGLLQVLGVTGAAAYSPALPSTISTAVQTGVHIDAGSSQAAHVSLPVETAAGTSASAVFSPSTAATPAPQLSAVIATVLAFQAVEVQPVVVITGHAAIFYDAHAVATNIGDVTSVTYNFQDGFSISLVGLPSELAHAGIHI